MERADRADIGARGEDAAVRYLEANGWRIVARNYRRREGEIDVIAGRDGTLAFVEVKTRRTSAFGSPAEAVTRRKQTRIRVLARHFLMETGIRVPHLRFDVIEVIPRGVVARIEHIEGAF